MSGFIPQGADQGPVDRKQQAYDLFHSKLANLAQEDGIWNGYVVMNENGRLERVNFFKYLPHFFQNETEKLKEKEQLKSAILQTITRYEEFVTASDLGLIRDLARNAGISGDPSVQQLMQKLSYKIFEQKVMRKRIRFVPTCTVFHRGPSSKKQGRRILNLTGKFTDKERVTK